MNPLIYKLSVRNGLIISGISAVLTIALFVINPLLAYTNLIVPFLILALVITLFIVLGLDVRRGIGGFWSFGQAFLSLMIMGLIAGFISIIISFVIFKFVDPNMPAKVNDALLEVTTQRLEKMGMDQAKIDDTTKKFTDGESVASLQPTFLNELEGFGWSIIFYAVLNLIIAACIKKNPPMFAPISDQEMIE